MTWEVASGGDRYPGAGCREHSPPAGLRSLGLQVLSLAWELVRTGGARPPRPVDSRGVLPARRQCRLQGAR